MADTISATKDTVADIGEEVKDKAEDIGTKVKSEVEPYVARRTETRVQETTPEEINRQIRRDLKARVLYFAQRPEEIDRRLDELEREWDIERLLEANAGIFSLMGLTFGVIRSRWYLLPAAAAAFLVQYAAQGWCPPVSLLRRIGIRTTREINHERYALKALRGDFDSVRLGAELEAEERARRAIDAADANT
jgi:Flp pilus assembly protein TadB